MTEHVVTRWYRPPELMLCPDGLYTYAVDLWSVGCIFAELLGRQPLFPGNNFVDQLTLIFGVIGSPSAEEVAHIRNNQVHCYYYSILHVSLVVFAF
jgi:serine/threonine protein kinase